MTKVTQNNGSRPPVPLNKACADKVFQMREGALDGIHGLLDEAEKYAREAVAAHILIDGMRTSDEMTPGVAMLEAFNVAASRMLLSIEAARDDLDRAVGSPRLAKEMGVTADHLVEVRSSADTQMTVSGLVMQMKHAAEHAQADAAKLHFVTQKLEGFVLPAASEEEQTEVATLLRDADALFGSISREMGFLSEVADGVPSELLTGIAKEFRAESRPELSHAAEE